jgi:hypothetical protein
MIIPSAEMIEQALDQVAELDAAHHDKQLNELGEALGEHATSDIQVGYLLGVQTARVLLAGMPAAIIAKVQI